MIKVAMTSSVCSIAEDITTEDVEGGGGVEVTVPYPHYSLQQQW